MPCQTGSLETKLLQPSSFLMTAAKHKALECIFSSERCKDCQREIDAAGCRKEIRPVAYGTMTM